MRYSYASPALMLLTVACGETTEIEDTGTVRAALETEYLTPGKGIPVGEPADLPPMPYSEEVFGPLMIDREQPVVRNLGRKDQLGLPKRPRLKGRLRRMGGEHSPPTQVPGVDNGETGKWIVSGTGIYAGSETETSISVSEGVLLYAPTHMPDGYSCLEMVTVHWNVPGPGGTQDYFGIWNHCDDDVNWIVYEQMNATWKSKYERWTHGRYMYYSQIKKDIWSCYRAWIYNYTDGVWDPLVDSGGVCGQSDYYDGWTMWEYIDFGTSCPTINDISVRDLKIQTSAGGGLTALTAGHTVDLTTSGDCFDLGTYDFDFAAPDWDALTPP